MITGNDSYSGKQNAKILFICRQQRDTGHRFTKQIHWHPHGALLVYSISGKPEVSYTGTCAQRSRRQWLVTVWTASRSQTGMWKLHIKVDDLIGRKVNLYQEALTFSAAFNAVKLSSEDAFFPAWNECNKCFNSHLCERIFDTVKCYIFTNTIFHIFSYFTYNFIGFSGCIW